MKLQGAERGKVRLKSDLLTAYVVQLEADGTPKPDAEPDPLPARFIFIPEEIEDLCESGALLYLRELLKSEPGPDQVEKQKRLLMVSWGLRQDANLKQQVYPFPTQALAEDGGWARDAKLRFANLRAAAIRRQCPNAPTLWKQYELFKDAEFPPELTQKDFLELYELGKSLSLATLACASDSWKLPLALPGLVAAYRRFEAGSGGAG